MRKEFESMQMQEEQKKIVKQKQLAFQGLIGFFVGIVLLTIVSGGASALTTPKVNIIHSRGGRIDYTIEATGEVVAKGGQQIEIPEDLVVERVFVSEGEKVTSGTPLIQLSQKILEEKLQQAKLDLKKQQLQMEQLKLQREENEGNALVEDAESTLAKLQDKHVKRLQQEQIKIDRLSEELQQAQANLEEAKTDYEAFTATHYDDQLEQATKEVDVAKKDLEDKTYEQEKAIKRAEQTLKEARERLWLLGGEEATSALQALERAQMELDMTKEDWKRQISDAKTLLNEKKEKLNILQTEGADEQALKQEAEKVEIARKQVVIKTREIEDALANQEQLQQELEMTQQEAVEAIEEAQQETLENQEDYMKNSKNQAIKEELMQMDMDEKQAIVNRLEQLMKQEGQILAVEDGFVGKINLEEGHEGTGEIIIFPEKVQYVFEVELTKSDAEKVAIGDKVGIMLDKTGYPVQGDTVISRISDVKDSTNKKITVNLGEGLGEQSGKITIKKQSEPQQAVVSIDAMRQDGQGKFVLVAREEVTTLGTQLIAVRIPVVEIERNDKVAGVQGAITPQDKIIVNENKPIEVGDDVRVVEQ